MKSPVAYFLRMALFAALITAPAVAAFRLLDPFKMYGFHECYIERAPTANKSLVSVRNFEHYDPSRHFDAFIVGPSVSCNYLVDDWRRHIAPGCRPFHFDGSGMTVGSLRRSVDYLDRHLSADSLREMLIVMHPPMFREPDPRRPFMDPPELDASASNTLSWHYTAFRSFTDCNFLVSYLHWLADGNARDRSKHRVFYGPQLRLIPEINEERLDPWEDSIDNHPAEFYAAHPIAPAAARDSVAPAALISPAMEADLRAVAAVVERRGTRLRIIFPPNRAGIVPHPADDSLLRSIFGRAYVNFAAEMRGAVADSCGFYDHVHYRPRLARRFMERAYGSESR